MLPNQQGGLAMSKNSLAIAAAELLAAQCRDFVWDEIKRSWNDGYRPITQGQLDKLDALLAPLIKTLSIPLGIRDDLVRGVWLQFKEHRRNRPASLAPGVELISTKEAADRRRRLGFSFGRKVRLGIA